MRTPTCRPDPRRRSTNRRPALRWVALVVGCFALLPSIFVAPVAAAHEPVGTASAAGVRAIDFHSVEHGIDWATSAVAVEAVRHGDLDGDGAEEAIVVLAYDTDHGSEWLVQTYASAGSTARPAGRTHGFVASWEHFDRIAVHDGVIEFTVRSGSDAGRDGWLEVQRWALVDDRLRLLERRSGGAVHTLDSVGPAAPAALPEWASRTYLDVGPGGTRRGVTIGTSEAKSLRMRADDPAAQVRLYDAATGRLMRQLDAGEIVALGGPGNWYVEPVTAADRWTRVEITVADQRALYAPELVARQFEAGNDSEPRRHISLAWYELAWTHGPSDLDRINGLIRDYVDGIVAEHEAAAALCQDGTDATLFVGATPELVSYDLVSIRFTIASCLCERNDEVVEASIVIDLAAGSLVDASELVTNEVLVSQAWWARFGEFQAQHFGPLSATPGSPLDFTSVSLTPHGLSVTVAAADIDADAAAEGARWGITEYLAFDDYPGLVDPVLEERARSGRDVELPHYGCGC